MKRIQKIKSCGLTLSFILDRALTSRKNLIAFGIMLALCHVEFSLTAQEQSTQTVSTQNARNSQTELQEIKGIVYNAASNKPMHGVRIQAYGTNRYAAISNEEGLFSIKVPAYTALLYVNAPDCNPQEVALHGQTDNIVIRMYSNVFLSDYERTSNVNNTPKIEKLNRIHSLSIDEEIGLYLHADVRSINRSGTPAMGAAMFINGLGSLNSSAQPLFVLDGVILELQDNGALHDGYYNNLLSAINVDDIDNITVMKNGTSLYGAKGGNGVVIIQTKRAKSMATSINVMASAAIETPSSLPTMMDADNFRLYASDLLGADGHSNYAFLNEDPSRFYYNKYHNNTNWSDETFHDAFTQKYSVSVQGGDQVAMYNLSLGFVSGQSTLVGNDMQRLNLRFNTDVSLLKKLSTRFDVSYSNSRRHLFNDGATEDYTSAPVISTHFLSLIKAPILSPYQYDIYRNHTSMLEDADDYLSGLEGNNSYANPLSIIKYGTADNKNYQQYDLFTLSITPQYDINKNLSLSSQIACYFTDDTEKFFSPMTGVPVFYIEGKGDAYNQAMSQYSRKTSIYIDTKLHWKKQIEDQTINTFAGVRYIDNTYQSNSISGYNTGSDKMPNISGSLLYKDVDGNDDSWRHLSYYLNAEYSIRGKYFLQGVISMDGSSRFGTEGSDGILAFGARWGIFPSIQAGWLVSSEKFMRALPCINRLKLTAGYNISGNDDIDGYASRAYFMAYTYLGSTTGLQLANIANRSISWESTKHLYAGLDMNLFNNRLNIVADIYRSNTDNLITLKTLNDISGLDSYWSNEGSLQNTGYNISLNTKIINTPRFKWAFGFSIGHYNNTITSLPDHKAFITNIYSGDILTQEGQAAGVFYGYETNGVFSTSSQAEAAKLYKLSSTGVKEYFGAGDMIFVDQDNNNEINEKDKVIIGDPNPDFYGNLHTQFTYRNWNLNVGFKYSYGNDVYNYLRSQLESGSKPFNQSSALQNRWITEGQITSIPKASYEDPMGNSRFSDRWIEDGSYLKLKNVTLSYTIPINSSWLQGLSVYGSAENLYTFTNYLGSNPETSMSNSVLYQGIDRGLLAKGCSFIFGIKINL